MAFFARDAFICTCKKEECDMCNKKYFDPITNADRIRAMTDEELANMWYSYVDCGECPKNRECNMLTQDCLRLALEWLKEEYSSDKEAGDA